MARDAASELKLSLAQIAEAKKLAAEAGFTPNPSENDAAFIRRVRGELQSAMAEAPPAKGSMTWRFVKKAGSFVIGTALLGLLGLR